MKVTSTVHPKGVIALPEKHFAILIEGAWLYCPSKGANPQIVAACPYYRSDTSHTLAFGRWDKTMLTPVNNIPINMPEGAHYKFRVRKNTVQPMSYRAFFEDAATRYPFIFLANKDKENWTVDTKGLRMVSLPIPNELRVCGTLLTAEVDGADITRAHRHDHDVKRLCTTFIFVYEFTDDLEVTLTGAKHEASWCAADNGTHLIFRVYPEKHDDDISEKCHTSMTFEGLRKRIKNGGKAKAKQCFDVGIYHDRGRLKFHPGDTGLHVDELGLPPASATDSSEDIGQNLRDTKLAACAVGGFVVDPTANSQQNR